MIRWVYIFKFYAYGFQKSIEAYVGIKDQIATFYDTFSYLNKEWQLNDTDILRGYCKMPIFSKN